MVVVVGFATIVVLVVIVEVVAVAGVKTIPLVLTRNVLLPILNTLQVGYGMAVFSGGAENFAEG